MSPLLGKLALAACLLGSSTALHTEKRDLDKQESNVLVSFINNFFHKKHLHARQDQECVLDDYYSFLQTFSSATQFCSNFISVPLDTVTVDFTPTV